MPGKSLTIRAPIPAYVKIVASYNGGDLVLGRIDAGRFHQIYVRLGPDQFDHVGDTGKPLPDDAARLAFVRDRVAKLHAKRCAEHDALRGRLAVVETELAIYGVEPVRDPVGA